MLVGCFSQSQSDSSRMHCYVDIVNEVMLWDCEKDFLGSVLPLSPSFSLIVLFTTLLFL